MAATNTVKANRYNHVIALFVCLGSYSYGFNSGIIGGVIGQPSWYSYFSEYILSLWAWLSAPMMSEKGRGDLS